MCVYVLVITSQHFQLNLHLLLLRFFKKREREKRLKKPLGDDGEGVEDVDDDEFDRLLSKSAEGNATFMLKSYTVILIKD